MVWYSIFGSHAGYAELSRQCAFALDDLGVDISIASIDPLAGRPEGIMEASTIERLSRLEYRDGDERSCIVTTWKPLTFQRSKISIGHTMFETDRIPHEWVHHCNEMDELWVPSQFNKDTFASSGVIESKIETIPQGTDPTHFTPEAPPLDLGVPEGTFKFLSVFSWQYRKGWDVLLEAYYREFRKSDDVVLVLRCEKLPMRTLQEARSSMVGKNPPPVKIIPYPIPRSTLPGLYTACDAFVLPSRGEGWGLPYCEAMACELPVIATNWSGQADYLTKDVALLVDLDAEEPFSPISYDMREVTGAEESHNWANPSVDDLRSKMRLVWGSQQECKKIGVRARKLIVNQYTWKHTAQRILERLEHLGAKI